MARKKFSRTRTLLRRVRTELEHHLEHCEDCRIVVDTTRKTVEIFCNAGPAALPGNVHELLSQTFTQMFRKGEPGLNKQ